MNLSTMNKVAEKLAIERDEARAIARGLSLPLRYHAGSGCPECKEHVAEFNALPWAKGDA